MRANQQIEVRAFYFWVRGIFFPFGLFFGSGLIFMISVTA
jgi:hypothetical protein